MNLDRDTRTGIAVREAREFKNRLQRDFLVSQLIMVGTLAALAYYDYALKWMVVVGFWLSAGTIGYILKEMAVRLDAGRSYLEIWSNDAGEALDHLVDGISAISPSGRLWSD